MKPPIIIGIITFLIFVFFCCSYAKDEPYDINISQLYAEPTTTSKVVYQIPIEVKMLEVSEDANWYKVYLKFNIGPMEFKTTGWTYIPIGTLLAERTAKMNLVKKF